LALAATAAQAESAEAALKRFVDGVQTLDARFEQVQTDDRGKITNRSSGHFWLARPGVSSKGEPGKFRWTYEKPYEQVSVCDGQQLWSFDPDLNQATVRDAKQALGGTPAALLSQRAVLSDAFTIADAGVEGKARLVKLKPKSKDSDFKSIELAIDPDGAPTRMRFADQIGGTSEITFSDTRLNTRIDPAQFRFTPPKGAEIVHGDGPSTTPESGP
jgi:outer membrane lipoprotein carrier protein